ncbi:50S ribosomal protein L9 [Chloroflexota bacterium]
MKVIFIQDVPKVANANEVKEVADGYARNFLIPRKLAVVATASEMKKLATHNYAQSQRQERTDSELKELAEQIEKLTLNLAVKVGAEDKIYGAITSSHIAEELAKATGHDIDKRKIEITEPIKKLGDYEISIHFAKDIIAKLKLTVTGE